MLSAAGCDVHSGMSFVDELFDSASPEIYRIQTRASGPEGSLPVTEEMLRHGPSGNVFGLTQNVGMGWAAAEAGRKQFLILSTQGGLRAPDGKPIALGYHTGHWEIGLMVQAAAEEFRRLQTLPFAGFCSDPCDGRIQGTPGMFDSLPYRNDAWRAVCRCGPACSGWPPATRECPRSCWPLPVCANCRAWSFPAE